MDILSVATYVATFITPIAFAFAIYEYYSRKKLESVLKTITQNLPGQVAKIEQSCTWAWANIKDAHESAKKLDNSAERDKALMHLVNASGDSAASARMCSQLFNSLLSFQEAQFETRKVTYGGKESLLLMEGGTAKR
ncbi:MAG: hypothetical protein ABI367_09400 [Mucilaginibacter sp.]